MARKHARQIDNYLESKDNIAILRDTVQNIAKHINNSIYKEFRKKYRIDSNDIVGSLITALTNNLDMILHKHPEINDFNYLIQKSPMLIELDNIELEKQFSEIEDYDVLLHTFDSKMKLELDTNIDSLADDMLFLGISKSGYDPSGTIEKIDRFNSIDIRMNNLSTADITSIKNASQVHRILKKYYSFDTQLLIYTSGSIIARRNGNIKIIDTSNLHKRAIEIFKIL